MTPEERIAQLESRVAELERDLKAERSWEPKVEKHYADMAEWNNQCHVQEMGFLTEHFHQGKLVYSTKDALAWWRKNRRVLRLVNKDLISYQVTDQPLLDDKGPCFKWLDEPDRFPFQRFE
jgi:hypothetical protein